MYVVTHLVLTSTLRGIYEYHTHFIDGETQVHYNEVISPKSHNE